MKKIVDNSKKYYEEKLKKFGPNIKGLNWKNKKSQELRFNILSKVSNLNNCSILDYGCGYGDFNLFLKKRYKRLVVKREKSFKSESTKKENIIYKGKSINFHVFI